MVPAPLHYSRALDGRPDIPPVIDVDEINKLWDLLPHPEGSAVRYMARLGERTVGDFAETPLELARAADAWTRDGYNFYVQVNPTRERGRARCRAEDITHWSWVLLDIDPQGVPDADPVMALAEYMHRLSLLTGTVLDPFVLDSGRGMQAWVRLHDLVLEGPTGTIRKVPLPAPLPSLEMLEEEAEAPITVVQSADARLVARRVHGYWLRHLFEEVGVVGGCVIDTSVCDLPRVMRCPGTINQKTGRMARIINPGTEHPLLASKMLTLTPLSEFKEAPPAEMMVEGRTWADVFPILSLTAQNFLRDGQDEPGRHKATVATVYALRDAGLTPEAALAGVARGNEKSLPEPLKRHELERMVRDAFAKLALTGAPESGTLMSPFKEV